MASTPEPPTSAPRATSASTFTAARAWERSPTAARRSCSQTTAALLDGEPLRDLGLHRLKDFEGATRLHQLGEGEFPPLRTPGSVDLPTPPTRFLGRERELFEAISLVLDRDPRVLTIVGPGGTGKTRFAIELARLLAEEADGSTLFVALAPLRDGTLVLPTIADRLGAPSPEPHGLAAATGGRRTQLVLDNAEHLLPAAAPGSRSSWPRLPRCACS